MKFLVINGPNLNMMHFTEPGVAGQLDYNGLLDYLELCCTQMGMEVEFFQSNHEGDLIDEIQSAAGRADGIVINPGGYAHYSVAILERCGSAAWPPWRSRSASRTATSRSARRTWSPLAVRAILSGRASAAICTPAPTSSSCSASTAAGTLTW